MSKRSSVWTLIRSWQLTFPVMGLLLGMAGITKAEDLGSRPQSWTRFLKETDWCELILMD